MNSKPANFLMTNFFGNPIKKKTALRASFLVLLALIDLWLLLNVIRTLFNSTARQPAKLSGIHRESTSFTEELFYRGLAEISRKEHVSKRAIKGMVVPHHYVASAMIADMFNRLAKQAPKTVIVIGPNHYEKGDYSVLASEYGWNTHLGPVMPDKKIIRDLVVANMARIAEPVMANEHSVGGLMPFIKRFLPEAKVAPLIVSRSLSLSEISRLAKVLSRYAADPKTVVVASVDFSHYLTAAEAQDKDAVTLALMRQRNYERLLTLDNGYMDSPPSIIAVFKVMEELGIYDFEVVHHNNSGLLVQDVYAPTTSYFTLAFYGD